MFTNWRSLYKTYKTTQWLWNAIGTLLLKLWLDERHTSGIGCCSVLSVACVRLLIYDICNAVLYVISCVAYTCRLRISALAIVIKTVARHITRVSLLEARTQLSLSYHRSFNNSVHSVSLPSYYQHYHLSGLCRLLCRWAHIKRERRIHRTILSTIGNRNLIDL